MSRHLLQSQSFTNLEQLRAYHNERFIRLAYKCILGREAEAEVLHRYLSLVDRHFSQEEFLVELCASPEAKSRWQGNDVNLMEEINNKSSMENNIIPFHSFQSSGELKELTSHARNIYLRLKSAVAINIARRIA